MFQKKINALREVNGKQSQQANWAYTTWYLLFDVVIYVLAYAYTTEKDYTTINILEE